MGEIAKKNGSEEVVYSGRILEIVEQPMLIGEKEKRFESARRAPGSRIIITSGDKILLTREHRFETDDFDYRLPGGKVFDELSEYRDFLQSGEDVLAVAQEGVIKECVEETGLIPENIEYFATALADSTVVWDLYYFVVDEFCEGDGQDLGDGEVIDVFWLTRSEIEAIVARGEMSEYRSVGMLYRYFLSQS